MHHDSNHALGFLRPRVRCIHGVESFLVLCRSIHWCDLLYIQTSFNFEHCVRVCVCARARARARVCVCVLVVVLVCECVCTCLCVYEREKMCWGGRKGCMGGGCYICVVVALVVGGMDVWLAGFWCV